MKNFHSVYYTAFLCDGCLGASGMIKREEEAQERRLKEKLAELKELVSEFEALDEKLTKLERIVRDHKRD